GQGTLLDLAVYHRHLVDELGVGEGGALRGQVVAAVGGVGIEVLFRQTHLGQVFSCCAAGKNGVRRGEVVRRDVVAQYGQRTHALEAAFAQIGRASWRVSEAI